MFRSTLLYLGIFTLFISIFSLLNILFCYYFDTSLDIKKIYLGCLLISLLLSAIFIFSNKKFLNEKINFFEILFLVIVGFFYFPLLISIPYYLSIYDISFINSYFEAISGFTSTGFTTFENTKNIDEPLLIWRSGSQWLGGLYFLCSLFLLAESPKIKIKNINLPTIENLISKLTKVHQCFLYFRML